MQNKMISRGIALAAGIAALSPVAAHAQVSNPGFEVPAIVGGFSLRNAGSNIGAWFVASGNVEIIRSYWQPNSGAQSLDMSGSTAGAIEQSISTIANHVYQISFAMAGNPTGGDPIKDLRLDFGASTSNFSFNTTGFTRPNMGWTLKTANFIATGPSTLLRFTSLENNSFGPALDDVQVTDLGPATSSAPEPTAVALAGLGLLPLGLVLRRRK